MRVRGTWTGSPSATSSGSSRASAATVGVLPTDLRDRLRGLGGFRNILVHGYLSLAPARVRRFAEHAPADFRAFSVAIRAWLATLPDPPRSER